MATNGIAYHKRGEQRTRRGDDEVEPRKETVQAAIDATLREIASPGIGYSDIRAAQERLRMLMHRLGKLS